MNSIISPGSFNTKRLAIVIVNWNAQEFLAGCLTSIARDHVGHVAEVVVLDSASTDGSAAMVTKEFPWVRLIASADNLGFSRGNNTAICGVESEFILLLNPDTVVDAGTIGAMLNFAVEHPEAGVVGPAQRSADGSLQFESAVNYPTIWNVFCDLALLSKFFPKSKLFASRTMGYWDHTGTREVPAVPGSALLVRRSVLEEIGLLDETLFCCEDADLCLRARQAGWKVFYLGAHSLIHYGGGSTKRSPSQGLQRQIAFQSFWLFLRKHSGSGAAARLSVVVGVWSVFAMCLAALLRMAAGQDPEKLNAAQRYRELVVSLAAWSRMDKLNFRHHLAAPPGTRNSIPRLEKTAV